MKAAKLYGVRDIRVEEVPVPANLHEDEVLIKIKAAGFCGSDISRYGKLGPHSPGVTFGHEFAGIVEQVGSQVNSVEAGDAVTACPSQPCFKCANCLQGKFSECEELKVLGSRDDGAFANYIKINARHVVELPGTVDFETAALSEPLAVCVHGFYRTSFKAGDSVAILGMGPIGLLALQCARNFCAGKIIAIDVFPEKLEIARQLGADLCINAKEVDPVKAVAELPQHGVDLAIESAGTPFTSSQILSLPRKGGSVLYLGIPYGDVNMPREHFEKILRNQLTVEGSWNSVSAPFPGREWETAVGMIAKGQIQAGPMITHRIKIEEIPETFEKIYHRDTFFGKVMVIPEKAGATEVYQ